jgi:two-component system, LytTR family, sensor kinase
MEHGRPALSRHSFGLLVLAWIPVWALYALLIGPGNPIHPGSSMSAAAVTALRSIAGAAALGFLVKRLTDRVEWPHPFRLSFALVHVVGALLYSLLWMVLTAFVESLLQPGAYHAYFTMLVPNLVLGAWLYVMIAGTMYASRATERVARAEAVAVGAQLAALRSQLNPHFLFNALHTVVHLIPDRPADASRAAEQVAGLLRTSIEEGRDLVSVEEELAFVQRYLDIERLRFGDRLVVQIEADAVARAQDVPAFAIQALVENAVRHGASPNVDTTTIGVIATVHAGVLTITVSDTGAGADLSAGIDQRGTGLRHLRERLEVLYGTRAKLDIASSPGAGFTARLSLPASDDQ